MYLPGKKPAGSADANGEADVENGDSVDVLACPGCHGSSSSLTSGTALSMSRWPGVDGATPGPTDSPLSVKLPATASVAAHRGRCHSAASEVPLVACWCPS